MAEARRTFVPVVLAGLATGVLAAVAGNRTWAAPDLDAAGVDASVGYAYALAGDSAGRSPLSTALALVVLACWGVLLVTRGRFRRAVAVLGALAAVGLVATAVVAGLTLRDDVSSAFRDQGATGVDAHLTWWYWAALCLNGAVLVPAVLAVRWVPAWPEMGSRYDAPTAGELPDDPAEEQSSLDLWKALDEGRDPTADRPE